MQQKLENSTFHNFDQQQGQFRRSWSLLFHDPRGRGTQTKCIVMMTKEGCTKIIKFHISHFSEYVFSSSLSIYFTLIAIVLKDYDAVLLYNHDNC